VSIEEPMEMLKNKVMQRNFLMVANAHPGGSASLRFTVEFAAIICTGLKSVFWAVRAPETNNMQWKPSPVQWKSCIVQRKVTPGAVER
jgi:hypothetical protein